MYPFLISVCLRRSLFHLHFGRIILQNIEFQVSEFFFQYFKYFTPLFFPSQFLKRYQILLLHLFLTGKIPPTCSSFLKIFSPWSLIIYNLNNICLSVFRLFVCLFVCQVSSLLFSELPGSVVGSDINLGNFQSVLIQIFLQFLSLFLLVFSYNSLHFKVYILSDMSTATPAFFWFQFAWKIFFHPLTFSLCVPRFEVGLL